MASSFLASALRSIVEPSCDSPGSRDRGPMGARAPMAPPHERRGLTRGLGGRCAYGSAQFSPDDLGAGYHGAQLGGRDPARAVIEAAVRVDPETFGRHVCDERADAGGDLRRAFWVEGLHVHQARAQLTIHGELFPQARL